MKSILLFFGNLTKWKKFVLLLSPIVTLILSMKTILIGLSFLIILDLITGIVKNLQEKGVSPNITKRNFWRAIKSYLLRKTWRKAYEYGLGIIVIAVFETLIFGTTYISIMEKTFTITELAVIIPAIIETWSIFENIESISKNNILKKIIVFLPTTLRRLFEQGEIKK